MSIKTKSKKHTRKYKKQNYKKFVLYGGKDKEAEKIMKEIKKDNTIDWKSVTNIPIIGPAIQKTENMIEHAKDQGIEAIENKLGVDLDNPHLIQDKINEALDDKQLFDKLEDEAEKTGKVGKLVVAATAPVIEEVLDKTIPSIAKHSEKIIKSYARTGINIAEDFLGPFIGIPRTIFSGAQAVQATANAASEVIKDSAEAIEGSLLNYKRLLKKEEQEGTIGGGIKKIKNEKYLIGGRIHEAKNAFMCGYPPTKKYKKYVKKNRNKKTKKTF